MNVIPCRVCSEVHRGCFPKAGLFLLFFHHPKSMQLMTLGQYIHQSTSTSSLAVTQASLSIFKEHQI